MSFGFSTAAEFAAQLCQEGFSWHLSGEGFAVLRSVVPGAVERFLSASHAGTVFFLRPDDRHHVPPARIFTSIFLPRATCGAVVMTSKGDGSGVALKVGDVLLVDPGYMVRLSVGEDSPPVEVDRCFVMPV